MKVKNKKLVKKLSSYTALAALGITSATFASAQVMYTDVNPDFDNYHPYYLDLNNDGIIDITLTPSYLVVEHYYGYGYYRSKWSELYSSVMADVSPMGKVAVNTESQVVPITTGSVIGPSLAFAKTVDHFPIYNFTSSNPACWRHNQEAYMGIRLQSGSNYYFGWARLKIDSYAETMLVVKDYAINLTPNEPILAGETGYTAVHQPGSTLPLTLVINNKQLTLLNLPPEYTGGEATVVDLQGRVIIREPISLTSLQLNLSSSPTGMYFIEVKKGNTSQRQKFVLN